MASLWDNRCRYCPGQHVAAYCQLAVITSTTAQLIYRQIKRPACTACTFRKDEKVVYLWFIMTLSATQTPEIWRRRFVMITQ